MSGRPKMYNSKETPAILSIGMVQTVQTIRQRCNQFNHVQSVFQIDKEVGNFGRKKSFLFTNFS